LRRTGTVYNAFDSFRKQNCIFYKLMRIKKGTSYCQGRRSLPRAAAKTGWKNKKMEGLRGNRSFGKPKNRFPFRTLHRRGGSPPLPPPASVDSFNSLQPEGRFCRRQAGRFAPAKNAVWFGRRQAVRMHPAGE